MASEENRERNEEFERRVLAVLRDQFETMEEWSPNGYEFSEFVITATYWSAPEPDAELHPWYGGPYPGWWLTQWTRGSNVSLNVQKVMLDAAAGHYQSLIDESDDDDD